MKVLIIEDEAPAARRLQNLIRETDNTIEILDVIDSVEDAVKWLNLHKSPEIIFMDIQLADGLSFEIFDKTTIQTPVIFTTAYDEYALRAFKVNSVDYLLKPIDKEQLKSSIDKFKIIYQQTQTPQFDISGLLSYIQEDKKEYKERFLVKMGERLISIEQNEIAYFMAEEKIVLLITHDNKKFAVDYTLEQLEGLLNPKLFFRLNRKVFAQYQAIDQVYTHFNGKLKVKILPNPTTEEEILVSREKSPLFKNWLDT